jgi:DNA primase catalytic subunit
MTSQLIFHIGASRTGTTTLQKQLLTKSLKNTAAFSKSPYRPSCKTGAKSEERASSLIKDMSNDAKINEIKKEAIFEAFALASTKLSIDRNRNTFQNCLRLSILKASNTGKLTTLISSERLSETVASVNGDSRHISTKEELPIYSACTSAKSLNITPLITLTLRHPIHYLRSKFIRTCLQRHQMKFRQINPREYIQKQSILENNHPGTSALTPAMHAEFIKQLQRHAFVKAFGFQELLASEDVFSLMGLQGEDKYAFRDFPRENKLPFTKEREQVIEVEITKALKQYGFYDRIMKAQIFE